MLYYLILGCSARSLQATGNDQRAG